jgi:uncharacterized membrane protein
MGFLLAQLILIFSWSLANLHVIPGLKAFDPFPFGVLALVVSSESVFLTIFVLISQSRMDRVQCHGRRGRQSGRKGSTPF